VTVAEEYISSAGLAENLYMKTDKSKVPNLDAVYPWFYETVPTKPKNMVCPSRRHCMLLLRKKLGIAPDSWSLCGTRGWLKVTSTVPLVVDALSARCDESGVARPLTKCTTCRPPGTLCQLDKLKVAKWYKDGRRASQSSQSGRKADAAMS